MVKRAVKLAESTQLFESVIVSLDSKEKSIIFQGEKAIVHLRPSHLASDYASTIDVVKEVIKSKAIDKDTYVCCLYPGSFLIGVNRIVEGRQLSYANPTRFIFSAQPVYNNPNRSFKIDKESEEISFIDTSSLQQNTQKLEQFYIDAGQFYWASAETWMKKDAILNNQSVPLILNRWESIDLDYPEDLEVALALHSFRIKNGLENTREIQ
jgi:N-acylneuraminate cytidylyltransferase